MSFIKLCVRNPTNIPRTRSLHTHSFPIAVGDFVYFQTNKTTSIDTNPEIIAHCITANTIVVRQFNNEMRIFRTVSNHRLAPRTVIRPVNITQTVLFPCGYSVCESPNDKIKMIILRIQLCVVSNRSKKTKLPVARSFTAFFEFFMPQTLFNKISQK